MVSAINDDFVGREPELQAFRDLCGDPCKQVLFIFGPGGIGKTVLIQRMLMRAKAEIAFSPLVVKELIDLNSTSYRHIDGLQSRIAELVGEEVGADSFSEYRKRPTSECFRRCLAKVCSEHPMILGLDTFERIQSDVTGNWVLSDDVEGLIVPGLRCIIGSREKPPTENRAVKPLPLLGFTLDQTIQLYLKRAGVARVDPDFIGPLGSLITKTKGHPLLLRIVFEWQGAGTWTQKDIDRLSQDEFEQGIMHRMRELGEQGLLYYYDRTLSVTEYHVIVLMSYLDRRFNSIFLSHLRDSGYVGRAPIADLMTGLEQLFFVKTTGKGEIQLHDEMARLIQQYIWPGWGELDGGTRGKLAQDVIGWYDELIERTDQQSDKDVLRAERLDYVFRYDLRLGKELLEEYSNLRSDFLDRLLPGEARKYVGGYSTQDRFEIYKRMAEMEARSQHYEQAARYWKNALDLASEILDSRWRVESLIGLHNCTWQRSPRRSLEQYLEPALALSIREVPDQKPRVEYEIGFAHRQLQNISQAIEWYHRALESVRITGDKPLQGTILNDLGYARTFLGEYQEAMADVQKAEEVRRACLQDIEAKINVLDTAIKEETNLTQQAELKQQLVDLEGDVAEARLKYGMTLNTLGEISRFSSWLLEAESHYTRALDVFKALNEERWQAKALHGRGEARRRLASDTLSVGNLASRDLYWERAQEDIDAALFLCEQHRINEERATAHRRMGRLLHDIALLQESQDPEKMRRYLLDALAHFDRGLYYALQRGDVLEELENSTEIAFIADDLARLPHYGEVAEQPEYIERFAHVLDKHCNDDPRIYQYSVFEDLLEMERGAYALVQGKYTEAMECYIRSFSGLASDPGYGSARYQMHYGHVVETIRKLPTPTLQEEWCKAFRDAWERVKIQGDRYGRTLRDVAVGFYEWCSLYLLTLEGAK